MNFLRRLVFVLAGAALGGAALFSTVTYAETDSNHPIRIIMRCPAGSPADLSVREVAKWWSDKMGRHYYVENVSNVPETVGMSAAARSGTDKYSMLFDLGDCENEASSPE
jgi:tripartite-type tricarboxylate transporter receptor subunit TctC